MAAAVLVLAVVWGLPGAVGGGEAGDSKWGRIMGGKGEGEGGDR